MSKFMLTGDNVKLTEFLSVVENAECRIDFNSVVEEKIERSRNLLNEYVESGRIIYGVNTGMGGFANYLVPVEFAEELQKNLISAVASNVGEYFDEKIVRAGMLARIISLTKGASAISIENFRILVEMFNKGVVPCIPKKGSLGASGDLGPLAYIALVGTGEWKASYRGEVMPGAEVLEKAGITPMKLSYKEGLSLINGTSVMVGLASVVWSEAAELTKLYEFISALSFEALGTKAKPFDPRVHARKEHKGQYSNSQKLTDILSTSELIVDETDVEEEIQNENRNELQGLKDQIEDAYSLRCTPQVIGPVQDTLEFISKTIEDELNSSSDNPLVIPEENDVFHNGHFHGQYISMAMDYLSIAMTTLSNLSDRRIDRYMDKNNSNGLPAFLCRENPGLRFGLMGGQFMSTSLTAENRSLCTPLSIQTLTSTGDFQDIVSFGLVAGRRAAEITENAGYIVAFELLCACQGADIRGKEKLSEATGLLFNEVRKEVPYFSYDTSVTPYVEYISRLLKNRELINRLNSTVEKI